MTGSRDEESAEPTRRDPVAAWLAWAGLDGGPTLAQLGVSISALLQEPEGWIRRRVETLRFADDARLERHVALSFALGKELPTANLEGQRYCLVPLGVIEKGKLPLFSVRDESGRKWPVLSRYVRGVIAAEGLLAVARGLHRELLRSALSDEPGLAGSIPSSGLPPDLEDDLYDIAAGSPNVAQPAFARLYEERARVPGAADAYLSRIWRGALMAHPPFRRLAWILAANSPVLVPVPYVAGALHSFELSYDEPLTPSVPVGVVAYLARRAWRTIGGGAKKIVFWGPAVPAPSSNHVRVIPPEGLHITTARFEVSRLGDLIREIAAADETGLFGRAQPVYADRRQWKELDREEGATRRAHLYSRAIPPGTVALARVNLRPIPSSVHRTIWTIALATLAVLVAGRHALDAIHGGSVTVPSGKHPDATTQIAIASAASAATQAAAALLLVGTGLVSLYVTRPGEHTLTSTLLSGLRALGGTCSFLTFAAAASLVGVPASHHVHAFWTLLVAIAAAIVMALTVSLVASTLVARPPNRESPGLVRSLLRRRLEGVPAT